MLPFYSGPTEYTPKAEFSNQTGLFEITGISRPENVSEFYDHIVNWLKDFEKQYVINGEWKQREILMNIKLTYCNSATSKYLYKILEVIKVWTDFGLVPVINWYYDEEDDKMLEDGHDISEALGYDFNFIPVD
jgi:hypothetical protein